MAKFKHFKHITRLDKNARFNKTERRDAFEYISLRFKQRDEGRAFFRVACRVAVKSGWARYTKYYNWVPEGSWVGGVQGLKSILSNEKNKLKKEEVSNILNSLKDKGYLSLSLNGKKFEIGLVYRCVGDEYYLLPEPPKKTEGRNGGSFYQAPVPVTRWNSDFCQEGVIKNYNNAQSEGEYDIDWYGEVETDMTKEENNLVYNYSNEGWVALPKAPFDERARMFQERKDKRNRCERTKRQAEKFSPCEAFLDLLSHSVFRDFDNFFSWFCPCVMIGDESLLTCRNLALRWGWGKSEVQRFLKEHNEVFECVTMPGNCGTVIFAKKLLVLDDVDKEELFVPSVENLSMYLKEVVGEGHIDRAYANDYVSQFSFLFVRKYFCRGVFCPEGDATKRFVKLCQEENEPIIEEIQFAPFTMENIHAIGVPREWSEYFGESTDLPDFWPEL